MNVDDVGQDDQVTSQMILIIRNKKNQSDGTQPSWLLHWSDGGCWALGWTGDAGPEKRIFKLKYQCECT